MTLKLNEIRDMSVDELKSQLSKSDLELTNLRMKLASRQLEDLSLIRKTRKEIARVLTVLTEKLKEGNVTEVKPIAKKEKKTKKIIEAKIEKMEEKKEKTKKKVKAKKEKGEK